MVRRTWLSCLVVASLLWGSGSSLAQQPTPIAVVSISGYDELRGDLEMIGKLGGTPELAKMVEGFIAIGTGGRGLAGLDKARPLGAVVYVDGEEFPVIGFVPVTNLKSLLQALAGPLGEAKDAGQGVYEISVGETSLYVKQQGGWAFVASEKDLLDKAPADPLKLLAGQEKKYDLAVSLSVKNLPEHLRNMVAGLLQMGAQQALEKQPGETDEQHQLRVKLAQRSLEEAIKQINDLDTVLLGLNIDQKTKTAYVDLQVTAKPGTQMAKEAAMAAKVESQMLGFVLPDAVFSVRATGPITEADRTSMKEIFPQLKKQLLEQLQDQGLSDEQIKKAKELLEELFTLLEESAEAKAMDMAASLVLKADALSLLMGGSVPNGTKIEAWFKKLVKAVQEEEPAIENHVKLNADTYEGVNLHVATVPLPPDTPDAEKLSKLLGPQLDIVLGTAPNALYLAIGQDAEKLLKKAITQSKQKAGTPVIPTEMSFSLGKFLQFLQDVAEDQGPQERMVLQSLTKILAKSGGKDNITLKVTPVPNGVQIRLELQEGVLSIFGALPQMGMIMGAPGMPAAPKLEF
ncbi:MAG: hypothetical protein NZ602_16615 [Thermoguttaceae bacterium]|nr:hypothetical protein [Thermoguttaceae bacterium]MDW8037858.1 hypothetical protein [Thermoguttaceae bacterium]